MLRRVATPWLLFLASAGAFGEEPASNPEGLEFFEAKIRPVLIKHCYECHSADSGEPEGGLRLDTRQAMRSGGDSGPAIGAGEQSLILQALRHESLEMPPDRRLPDEIIADFERWLSIGAPDPRSSESTAVVVSEPSIDWKAAGEFWAFQTPQLAERPEVENVSWPTTRLDYFVLHRLEQSGLQPSPRAPPYALIRRLSFDLIGLPPQSSDLDALADEISSQATKRIIERLISSPQFGERWARMWLDLARYAEDQAHIVGNNKSLFYPNAYRYRDWVIGALNQDLPFDQFVRMQLAADLIAPEDRARQVALGFIGLGPKYYNRGRLDVKAEEWEDRVDTVSRGLLGLTVACARCHDHKYDPVLTEDYYAMAGVFASSEMFNMKLDTSESPKEEQAAEKDKGKKTKNPEDAFHVVREGKPTDLQVFLRGNVETKGELIPRGFLRILGHGERQQFKGGSGRLELAEAIVSRDNPLTARVFVNRVWGQLIGKPLVGTPSNFGALGDRPTHPELLDDLAVRFMDNNWSIKWLVREIVSSATYQQSSVASQKQLEIDPGNVLLSSMNRRRLDVEAWRDSVLFCSKQLDENIGGPSMDPQQPDARRRTIYSEVSRFKLNPMLALFDFPDANVHSARRIETTTPIQKLFTMNHPLMTRQSKLLVQWLFEEAGAKLDDRVETLYWSLFSRAPEDVEIDIARQFLGPEQAGDQEAWIQYAQGLLASNEMLFLD